MTQELVNWLVVVLTGVGGWFMKSLWEAGYQRAWYALQNRAATHRIVATPEFYARGSGPWHGEATAIGQDATLAVSFTVAFTNACNFVMLTENGAMDGAGSGSISVNNVTTSGFAINRGTDGSRAVRWLAEGY